MTTPNGVTTNGWRILLASGGVDAGQDVRISREYMDVRSDRAPAVEQALLASPHRLVQTIPLNSELAAVVGSMRPDMVILEFPVAPPRLLEQIKQLIAIRRIPIVVFAARANAEDVRAAIRAGVSAYVVDGLRIDRVLPVLEAAMTRFVEFEDLRLQRDVAQAKLSERRDIERAKGILMTRRHLGEQAAYDALRKLAMDRGIKMIEAAQGVIAAEELLGSDD